MARTLFFCVKAAILVGIAVWLAGWPSEVSFLLAPYRIDLFFVTFDWPGYRIDTNIGVLIFAAAIAAILVALLYRFWRSLYRAPGDVGRAVQSGRRRRGYKALTQGMVAVAAGEPDEASRWAKRADTLLDEPPLTMLLSAQAAQLTGDEAAAKRYFTAMLDSDETRFLGLRGLLTQAMRDGDTQAALDYVRQIRKTPIVVNDARFFYANRCIIPYINEGVTMVKEGVSPALIENAAKMVGMPLGPLQLTDETSIDLGVKIAKAT